MITREDILTVAYDLKMLPLDERRISFILIKFKSEIKLNPDKNGELIIENLLHETKDGEYNYFIDSLINELEGMLNEYYLRYEGSIKDYLELFLIPNNIELSFTSYVVNKAIHRFIDNNESTIKVRAELDDTVWKIIELDSIEYDEKLYSIRHIKINDDGDVKTYTIAPLSLLDAMIEKEGEDCTSDDTTEAFNLDNVIYYYMEDDIFYNNASELCRYALDVPMELIEEIL